MSFQTGQSVQTELTASVSHRNLSAVNTISCTLKTIENKRT